jgi:hypothetical protein
MTSIVSTRPAQVIEVQPDTPAPQTDLPGLAERSAAQALSFCAQKMGLDTASAVDRLRQNDRAACQYCMHSLAQQAARILGALDEHLKVAYELDYDATPDDVCFAETPSAPPLIHLIVWTARKTAASDALVSALDRALIQAYARLVDRPPWATMLDVHFVDDAEVENRSGYGALFGSLHHRPIPIWQR